MTYKVINFSIAYLVSNIIFIERLIRSLSDDFDTFESKVNNTSHPLPACPNFQELIFDELFVSRSNSPTVGKLPIRQTQFFTN